MTLGFCAPREMERGYSGKEAFALDSLELAPEAIDLDFAIQPMVDTPPCHSMQAMTPCQLSQ